jgi:gluconolactonase
VLGDAPRLVKVAEVDAHEGPVYAPDEDALYFTTLPQPPGRVPLAFERPLSVERSDPRLDDILSSDARLEQVAGGFEFTEGPVWSPEGALLFSSPNTNVIYPLGLDDRGRDGVQRQERVHGRRHRPLRPAGLERADLRPRRPARHVPAREPPRRSGQPAGDTTVLADGYRGKRLNSPNDLVFRSDGTLYFTDPPFGLPGMADDPERELPSGVYSARDGFVRLETDELEAPNGLAFSPDERYLYVGDWDLLHKVVMRYEVAGDGSLSNGTVFHDMTGAPGEDAIDGVKVDRAGNVYACGPGGIWVLSPEGDRLGLIELPEDPHNLAWGDDDGRTLYITALTGVYRIRLGIPSIRPTKEDS